METKYVVEESSWLKIVVPTTEFERVIQELGRGTSEFKLNYFVDSVTLERRIPFKELVNAVLGAVGYTLPPGYLYTEVLNKAGNKILCFIRMGAQ